MDRSTHPRCGGPLPVLVTPTGPLSERNDAAPPGAPNRVCAAAADASPPAVGMIVKGCGGPNLLREWGNR